MTAYDYRTALDRLSLTVVGAARLLGVDDDTSRRWAFEVEPVPEPVARFLRFLVKSGVRPDEVMKILSENGQSLSD